MFKAPNKIIFNQDRKKQLEIHHYKIQNVKCSIDHHLNSTVNILRFKPHNIFQELEIQKQNQIHAQRIINIQASSQLKFQNLNSSVSGYIHNRTNNQSISGGDSTAALNKILPLGTLHQGFFKKQKRKMNEENQTFFRRIQSTKSTFDVLKWQQEAEERKKILLVRSEFPQQYKQNQNGNQTHYTSIKSQNQTVFNNSYNNQSIDINKSISSNTNRKKNNHFNTNHNNQITSSILKDQSQLEINNQSQQQLNSNDNNESINLNDQGSTTGMNENEKKQRNKFLIINNLSIPTDFYFSMNSDTERTNYLKKFIRESRKILFRKSAEIQGETFFTEVKIEQKYKNQKLLFNILVCLKLFLKTHKEKHTNLNYHKQKVNKLKQKYKILYLFNHLGEKYFSKECHDNVQELLKKIKLNHQDKTVSLAKQRQIVILNPIQTKYSFKLKSMNQTKKINSTHMLSRGDIHESRDESEAQNSDNKIKNNHFPNKSINHYENLKGQNKQNYKTPNAASQLISKKQYKSTQALTERKGQVNKIQEKVIQNKSQKLEINNKQQQGQIKSEKKVSKESKSVNQQNNKNNPKVNAQNTKQTSKQVNDQKNIQKENQIQDNSNVEEPEEVYEDDYDQFDEEDGESQKDKNDTKVKQQDKKNEDIDEEYQDPFDKFDEEEEQQKKEQKSPLNQSQSNHGEPNKKMIKFSFNDTGYKKKQSQESFNSKQNANQNNQKAEQSKAISPANLKSPQIEKQLSHEEKEQTKVADNNKNLERKSSDIDDEQENPKDQSVNYEEEFEQDSGTQYEINDADKEIIEKKNPQVKEKDKEQNKIQIENQNNEKENQKKKDNGNDNYEEEYEEDFDQ